MSLLTHRTPSFGTCECSLSEARFAALAMAGSRKRIIEDISGNVKVYLGVSNPMIGFAGPGDNANIYKCTISTGQCLYRTNLSIVNLFKLGSPVEKSNDMA